MKNRCSIGLFLLVIIGFNCSSIHIPILPTTATAITIQKTTKPIQIDGQLTEPIYRKLERVYLKNSLTDEMILDAHYTTYAQLAYDEQYLYIAFHCKDQDIHSQFTQRDDNLWQEEVVEVFIDTNGQPNDYLEVEVSPKNVFYDSFIIDPNKIDVLATKAFNLTNYKTAVQVNGTTTNRMDQDQDWTVEIALPLAELVEDYTCERLPQYQWKLNLCRLNRDAYPVSLMAWLPTGNRFHRPEKFGTLMFGR